MFQLFKYFGNNWLKCIFRGIFFLTSTAVVQIEFVIKMTANVKTNHQFNVMLTHKAKGFLKYDN